MEMKHKRKIVATIIILFTLLFVGLFGVDIYESIKYNDQYVLANRTNLHLYVSEIIREDMIISKEVILSNAQEDEVFEAERIQIYVLRGGGSSYFVHTAEVTAYRFRGEYYVKLHDILDYVEILRGELWITNLPSIHAIKSW